MLKTRELEVRTHCSYIKVHNVQGLTMCVVSMMCKAIVEIQFAPPRLNSNNSESGLDSYTFIHLPELQVLIGSLVGFLV
jgi:hypothetical protein